MIFDSKGTSPAIEAKAHARQPEARWRARPRIIYILVVLMLASMIGGVVFAFSLLSLSNWLWFVYLIFLPAFSVVFLSALFQRKWNELARCLVIGPIVLFPLYAKTGSLRWLYVEAFRLHASPTEDYLARCKLIEFTENGAKQVFGKCDSLNAGGDAAL